MYFDLKLQSLNHSELYGGEPVTTLLSSRPSEYVSVLRLCMTPTEVTKKKRILATSTVAAAASRFLALALLASQEGQMKESSDC